MKHLVQSLRTALPDIDFPEKEIGNDPDERKCRHNDQPGDSGSRITMRAQQNPSEDCQLEHRNESKNKNRVVVGRSHGVQG